MSGQEPLEFVVKGEPVPKGRPIPVKRGTRIELITPPTTRAYEGKVAWTAKVAMKGRPLFSGRLRVTALFYHSAKKGRAKRDAALTVPKGTKPDTDNLFKALLDGMNRIVFADDGQVASIIGHKAWAPVGEEPRTEVRVEAISGDWPPDDALELF